MSEVNYPVCVIITSTQSLGGLQEVQNYIWAFSSLHSMGFESIWETLKAIIIYL